MVTVKKNDLSAQLTDCINALTANYPASQAWVFKGTPYKRGDIVNLLNGALQAMQTTKQDHDTWIASTKAEQAQLALVRPVLASLKLSLEVELGADSPKIATYGFPPSLPPVRTAASKAASAAKAKATRAAKKAALAAVGAPAPAAPAPVTPAAPSKTA